DDAGRIRETVDAGVAIAAAATVGVTPAARRASDADDRAAVAARDFVDARQVRDDDGHEGRRAAGAARRALGECVVAPAAHRRVAHQRARVRRARGHLRDGAEAGNGTGAGLRGEGDAAARLTGEVLAPALDGASDARAGVAMPDRKRVDAAQTQDA